MRWAWHIASIRTGDVLTGFWWGETQGKRPLGRSGRRWKDKINMDIQLRAGRNGLDRSGTGKEQVAGACECVNQPSGSIKCGEFLG
jgi:hypothetical protein